MQILKLDQSGHPKDWISYEDAIIYHAKNLVQYQIGEDTTVFRGGMNRLTGEQSKIWTAPIISVRGEHKHTKTRTPALTNRDLFARDRFTCAYCGRVFAESKLTRDHIIPVSRGGKDVWMNVVTACNYDNHYKDNKLLEEVGMELLYAPYVPNQAEHLILRGRKILPIQAEYLAQFVNSSSRVLEHLKAIMH